LGAEPLLAIDGIDAGYGKVEVLHGVSLYIAKGEIVTIIGPNGAGKSTALKAIMGYLKPSTGRIYFKGKEITARPVHEIVTGGIGYVPQGRITFQDMTVLENLEMGAFFIRDRAVFKEALEKVFQLFPPLAERKKQLAGTMSGGEQQMVAIGRALMTHPECVILDEPSLGLSPKFVELIFAKLTEMRGLGLSLLLVEQNAARALAVSDRGYVLELGRNYADGTGADLLASTEIRRMFIGG
jgi:ABC-type branched-subunit amino acid transport system ATPase component